MVQAALQFFFKMRKKMATNITAAILNGLYLVFNIKIKACNFLQRCFSSWKMPRDFFAAKILFILRQGFFENAKKNAVDTKTVLFKGCKSAFIIEIDSYNFLQKCSSIWKMFSNFFVAKIVFVWRQGFFENAKKCRWCQNGLF